MMKNSDNIMQKIQNATHDHIVKCAGCGNVFAACVHGLQDAEWDASVRKYRSKGYVDEIVPKKSYIFQKCSCKKESKLEKNPNQTELF